MSKPITIPVTTRIETKVAGIALVIFGNNQITSIVTKTNPREYKRGSPDIQTDSPLALVTLN